jgi:hypothetical protein
VQGRGAERRLVWVASHVWELTLLWLLIGTPLLYYTYITVWD